MKLFTNMVLAILVLAALLYTSNAANIVTDNSDAKADLSQDSEGQADLKLQHEVQFRRTRNACIDRGENCDHRPDHCCESLKCRCNLWGANCRCQLALLE